MREDVVEILALARESGFREARHVPAEELDRRYFEGRTDGVRPSRGEELMPARVTAASDGSRWP